LIRQYAHCVRASMFGLCATGAFAFFGWLDEGTALACGVPPPGSPPGFHCGDASENEDGREQVAGVSKFRTSASYTLSSTRIVFGGERKADVERSITGASVEFRASDVFTAQLSLGLLTVGTMKFPDSSHRFGAGLSLGVSGSYRVVKEKDAVPFVFVTGTVGYAHAKTRELAMPGILSGSIAFNAFDLRFGAVVGKTFGDIFAVYATGRVFGGPIFWKLRDEALTGTDLYKYQLGLGTSFSPIKRVDLFAEWVALGERSLSFGAGISY
jgi:hypothetical protein